MKVFSWFKYHTLHLKLVFVNDGKWLRSVTKKKTKKKTIDQKLLQTNNRECNTKN